MDGSFRCILYCSVVDVSGILEKFVGRDCYRVIPFRRNMLYNVEHVHELLNTRSYKEI
jgi:hypothetical protein